MHKVTVDVDKLIAILEGKERVSNTTTAALNLLYSIKADALDKETKTPKQYDISKAVKAFLAYNVKHSIHHRECEISTHAQDGIGYFFVQNGFYIVRYNNNPAPREKLNALDNSPRFVESFNRVTCDAMSEPYKMCNVNVKDLKALDSKERAMGITDTYIQWQEGKLALAIKRLLDIAKLLGTSDMIVSIPNNKYQVCQVVPADDKSGLSPKAFLAGFLPGNA